MARPRSEDKHAAILDAAIQLIAQRGLAATPTSAISKAAGVAEGTLFTYFKTKDALVNALYLHIKREMADNLLGGFPHHAAIRQQLQYIWNSHVRWGMVNRTKKQVMDQLVTATAITDATRASVSALFVSIEHVCCTSIANQVLRDYPVDFIWSCMARLGEVTMAFMAREPDRAEHYQRIGFEMWWNGVACVQSHAVATQ